MSCLRKVFIAGSIAAVLCAAPVASWLIESSRRASCGQTPGKWIASESRCQTQSCVESQSCLSSDNNTQVCESLRPGMTRRDLTRRDLIFELGQPIRVAGQYPLARLRPGETSVLFFSPSAAE